MISFGQKLKWFWTS